MKLRVTCLFKLNRMKLKSVESKHFREPSRASKFFRLLGSFRHNGLVQITKQVWKAKNPRSSGQQLLSVRFVARPIRDLIPIINTVCAVRFSIRVTNFSFEHVGEIRIPACPPFVRHFTEPVRRSPRLDTFDRNTQES
ncbi:hypothetical protein RRG08_032716 [Elysia crispata]|uniref:Uncharacterized protein n=1 Tax=Elysia crispata TaxID=231223 RepID=A0AAE0YVS8_9GAST|nr:hypothetical protein RRG08_032716 [Elysia crispata]